MNQFVAKPSLRTACTCRLPELHYAKSRFNKDILARCPSLTAVYRTCPLLTNGHVETIFAAVFRKDPGVRYYRRCVIMQDGAAVALDFELLPPEQVGQQLH